MFNAIVIVFKLEFNLKVEFIETYRPDSGTPTFATACTRRPRECPASGPSSSGPAEHWQPKQNIKVFVNHQTETKDKQLEKVFEFLRWKMKRNHRNWICILNCWKIFEWVVWKLSSLNFSNINFLCIYFRAIESCWQNSRLLIKYDLLSQKVI